MAQPAPILQCVHQTLPALLSSRTSMILQQAVQPSQPAMRAPGSGVVRSPGGPLRQLDQAVLGSLRIEEGDAAALVADPRHLVDQRNALRLELGERSVDILDLETDVVQPALAF